MKIMYWLSRLFNGSVRAEEKRSPQPCEGESFDEAKLVKRSEAPKRGKFIINVSYRTNGISAEKQETFKGAAVWDFLCSSELLGFLTNLLLWSQIIPSVLTTTLLAILYWLLLMPKIRFS